MTSLTGHAVSHWRDDSWTPGSWARGSWARGSWARGSWNLISRDRTPEEQP